MFEHENTFVYIKLTMKYLKGCHKVLIEPSII